MDSKEFNLLLDEVSEQLDRISAQLNKSEPHTKEAPVDKAKPNDSTLLGQVIVNAKLF